MENASTTTDGASATKGKEQERQLDNKGDSELPPAKQGYRMPAEWEPHEQAWMGWPLRPDNWRDNAGPAQDAYAAVVEAILQFEPVTVCAPNPEEVQKAVARLPSEVEVLCLSQNDSWFRDSGPTFVVRDSPASAGQPARRELAGVDWTFNAWGGLKGGLYKDWKDDDLVASRILHHVGVKRFRCHAVMEGGSFHVDGEGTVLTTEECLLNPNRNPQLSKGQIEQVLRDHLSVSKVLWVPRGLYGDDDTNGHIDNLACFARPGVILLSWTDDVSDPQHAVSQEALAYLHSQTDAQGRSLQVIKLPVPPVLSISTEEAKGVQHMEGTKPREAGARMAASYVNFYLPNGGVVVPQFGGEAAAADAGALEVLEKAFPGRRVVGVPTRDILLGGGNIHCITQQEPSRHPA